MGSFLVFHAWLASTRNMLSRLCLRQSILFPPGKLCGSHLCTSSEYLYGLICSDICIHPYAQCTHAVCCIVYGIGLAGSSSAPPSSGLYIVTSNFASVSLSACVALFCAACASRIHLMCNMACYCLSTAPVGFVLLYFACTVFVVVVSKRHGHHPPSAYLQFDLSASLAPGKSVPSCWCAAQRSGDSFPS